MGKGTIELVDWEGGRHIVVCVEVGDAEIYLQVSEDEHELPQAMIHRKDSGELLAIPELAKRLEQQGLGSDLSWLTRKSSQQEES
ncbi:hypothetical protein [Ferrimicrobium acidiphilum]|uniref:hypothetical protein n=1 Tax=Ferrimicrobium acidiphilum TaxID=121039 RepID=UPI0023F31029|nr:hypothetical protein [Ferrimicrobium acidiphilum]